jgi:hypothetical protein
MQGWGMTFVTRTISALRAIFLPLGLARVVLWLGAVFLLSAPAFAQASVVTNVMAQQHEGTKLEYITYDVTVDTQKVRKSKSNGVSLKAQMASMNSNRKNYE